MGLRAFFLASLVLSFTAGCPHTKRPRQGRPHAVSVDEGTVLEVDGALGRGDAHANGGLVDHYLVPVLSDQSVTITLRSTDFDPDLEVRPPGGSAISNDDFQGSREVSQVEFVAADAGTAKVVVSSYGGDGRGRYHLLVSVARAEDAAADGRAFQRVSVGATVEGEIADGDRTLTTGERVDTYVLSGGTDGLADVVVEAEGHRPNLLVMTPEREQIQAQADEHGRAAVTVSLVEPGRYRIQVVAGGRDETGPYHLSVTGSSANAATAESRDHHQDAVVTPPAPPPGRTAAPGAAAPGAASVALGSVTNGSLARGDAQLGSGEFVDRFELQGQANANVILSLDSRAFDPYLLVLAPDGRRFENDDANGGRDSEIALALPVSGAYQIMATSYRPGEVGAYELKVRAGADAPEAPTARPEEPPPASLGGGVREGELREGDARLQSGEFADTYAFRFERGAQVHVALESTALDPFLIVRGPDGRAQQNDDVEEGNLNSALDFTVPAAGAYSIVATTYEAGMNGAYRLSVTVGGGAARPEPARPEPAGGPGRQVIEGDLRQGDTQIPSGEFVDEHTIEIPAGTSLRASLQSSDFDTYLIVRPPSGRQVDNDDVTQGNTNSLVEIAGTEAGRYRLQVTSYQPGETGHYRLTLTTGAGSGSGPGTGPGAGPGTAGNQNVQGALAQGDAQLPSGELTDVHRFEATAGERLSFRLTSTAFDTFLIVRSPSNRQLDNDDISGADRNSAIDIDAAEAGTYVVTVTSYRAGETGAYALGVTHGAAAAHPGTGPGGPGHPPNASGRRIFGVFAGITDYRDANDLPECANDAIKLAEELRRAGLETAAEQMVLTDGDVTRAGVRAAIQRMGAQAGPGDVFLFFYSGHGSQQATSARDEIDGQDETIYLEDGHLSDNEMAALYEGIHADVSILSLDSCFSGGFAKDVISAAGRVGFFSSEEDLTSAVAGQFQAGGYLSHFLRTGVGGEADMDPHDGSLTAGELAHYLIREFAQNVTDVESEDMASNTSFQHLVVDRGAVRVNKVLWTY